MKDVGNTFFNVMKHGMMNSELGAFKSDPFHKIAISTDLEINLYQKSVWVQFSFRID